MKNRIFKYLLKQKRLIIVSMISVIIFLLAQLLIPFLVGKILDAMGSIIDGHYVLNVNTALITRYIIIALILSILGIIFDYIFEISISIMTQNVIKEMRDDVFEKYLNVEISYIDKDSKGNLLQYEITDIENIANGIYSVFKQLVQGVFSIIITIILMFNVNWILALAVIFLTPLSVLASRFIANYIHKHFKKQAKLQSDLTAISKESMNNFDALKAMNYQNESLKEFKDKDELLRKDSKIALFASSWVNPTTRLVNNTIYSLVGILGIILIIYTPTNPILNMTIGALSSFLSYTNQYTKPFNEVSAVLSEFETAKYSFKRIDEFLNTNDDKDDGKIILKENINDIRFDHLYFSYTTEKKLIEDFSQEIKKGMKVAIVGPTGAGKSTIINVLMRFYDPTKGCIRYNEIDGKDIPKNILRSNFGMVLQETWIFTGSILDNVRYAKPDATDLEVKQACKDSHAEDFILSLENGYDTIISAKHGLSEGEKQLLTIARVMLLKPNIVILDEATSNVDTRTEMKINDAFDKIMEGRTSIVIAHRLSTIKEADLILVLKDGHVVEQGNHSSLLLKKGLYYSMYSSQFE